MEGGGTLGLVVVGIATVGALGFALALSAMRGKEPPPEEEEVVEEEEGIVATLKKGWVWWAGLTEWKRVSTSYLNTWPLDTGITFAWEIKNTGNVGAYFQAYMFDPGEWLYAEKGNTIEVTESFHTPVVPVSPGYEYYNITILGRKLSGERVGAVWTSEDVEVTYV